MLIERISNDNTKTRAYWLQTKNSKCYVTLVFSNYAATAATPAIHSVMNICS